MPGMTPSHSACTWQVRREVVDILPEVSWRGVTAYLSSLTVSAIRVA